VNKKIENKELVNCILNRLTKFYTNEFSEEELASISNIRLIGKLSNGKDTGISIEDVKLFKNLKSLTLTNYSLTMKDLMVIADYTHIRDVSFLGCFFDDIDFDELSRLPETLKFICCSNLPKKFPRVKDVIVDFGEIDFSSIDLLQAISLRIQNSKIKNISDINMHNNILEVNLDGSELIDYNGNLLKDINVGDGCIYSHNELCMHHIDDSTRLTNKFDIEK